MAEGVDDLDARDLLEVSREPVRGDPPEVAVAGRRLRLPTYPFERRRHWIDPPAATRAPSVATPAVPDDPGQVKQGRRG